MTGPESRNISVVVATKVGPPFVDRCLASLKDQVEAHGAEVIVVVPEADEIAAARFEAEHGWTRVVRSSDTRVPAMRRRGVEAAKGQIVAVIEEHCTAGPDWLSAIARSHSQYEHSAVGGAVFPEEYEHLRDWTVYYCEYSAALPPWPRGDTSSLQDVNIAYRRSVLMDHLHLLDEGYWPMTLHGALVDGGHRLLADPDMVVFHGGPFPFRYYLGQRFFFSRAYAGVRAGQSSLGWRLAYLLAAPVLPLVFLARMAARVIEKRCRLGKFVAALPLTTVALVVFVAGEWVGCLIGPGDALSRVE